MREIVIGNRDSDCVIVRVKHSDADGLSVTAEAQVGEFRGFADSWTLRGTLLHLAQELRDLEQKLEGRVEFSLTDGELDCEFVGDGKGHIRIAGTLRRYPNTELKFEFAIDQTYLGPIARELEAAER